MQAPLFFFKRECYEYDKMRIARIRQNANECECARMMRISRPIKGRLRGRDIQIYIFAQRNLYGSLARRTKLVLSGRLVFKPTQAGSPISRNRDFGLLNLHFLTIYYFLTGLAPLEILPEFIKLNLMKLKNFYFFLVVNYFLTGLAKNIKVCYYLKRINLIKNRELGDRRFRQASLNLAVFPQKFQFSNFNPKLYHFKPVGKLLQ